IWIENIPPDVYESAEMLLGDINEANKESQKALKDLLKQAIGEGGLGGGGGTAGNVEMIERPGLTVKGQPATDQQRRVAAEVLNEAMKYNPPRRATLSLLCAVIVESVMGTVGMTPATITDHDSVGILQARLSYVSAKNAMDIGYNVKRFL